MAAQAEEGKQHDTARESTPIVARGDCKEANLKPTEASQIGFGAKAV